MLRFINENLLTERGKRAFTVSLYIRVRKAWVVTFAVS